jgi:thymidylate kinase
MQIEQQAIFMSRKPQLFIIEGPDCSGKTALAKFIANKLNAVYMHSNNHTITENNLKCACINLMVSGLDVVMDRCWPSEQIYAQVLDRPANITSEQFAKCVELKATYIFCLGEECKARHAEHADKNHPYTDAQYNEIYFEYEKLANKMIDDDLKVWIYSIETHGTNMQEFIELVMK